jgi:hypothetical protein
MKTKRRVKARGFAQDTDIIPKIEGMDVEFDEKVTLFPVELEEIREVVPKKTMTRSRAGMH